MTEMYRRLIAGQFEASLSTLNHCIAWCPDDIWIARVARHRFCQVAFHVLYFADFYLSPDPEAFEGQPFHLAHPNLFGALGRDEEPLEASGDGVYPRADLEAYAEYCRRKAVEVITAETEEMLCAPAEFLRRRFSRAELHVYNIRHIQHHAAQMIMRLRLDTDVDVPWISSGWRNPAPAAPR
jgi:hypothetical protein